MRAPPGTNLGFTMAERRSRCGFRTPDNSRPDALLAEAAAGPGTRSIPSILVHRSLLLDPRDRTRHRRVPVTTAARTVIDLAALLDEDPLRQAVCRAQGLRHLSLPTPVRAMDRLGPRRGSATLRRIVATGPAPTKTVLEADGAAWHVQKVAREDDAERQAMLEAHGERVIRVTWSQAIRHPQSTLARIAAAGAPRPRIH